MEREGWYPDPFGVHQERLFKSGEPTPLVRDDGIGSFDAPPAAADQEPRPSAEPQLGMPHAVRRPARTLLGLSLVLIAVGLMVGVLGFTGVGRNGPSALPTTTENPFVQWIHTLPPKTTLTPLENQLRALPPTTTLNPLELALQALPRATTSTPSTPPGTTPPATSARGTSAPSRTFATRTTQPPQRPTPPRTTQPVAPAATLPATTSIPPTTTTTSPGPAVLAWYVAYGSVFNTLQTDVEKVDRTVGSTSQDLYSTVHPYWQGLLDDVMSAMAIPPVPDTVTQTYWTAALSDLSQGATGCINGSPQGVAIIPATFDPGAALIATGTTQLYDAASSLQTAATATSVGAGGPVQGWYQAHGGSFTTLQADVAILNGALSSTPGPDFSALDPIWQQLVTDTQGALALPPIPDTLIQSYWSTALNDLVQGASDCMGSPEALPPNGFDEGVALIQSGTTYLGTTVGAVQGLA